MQKMPSLYKRNYEGDRLIYDEVVEGCEWVLAGEGVPTRKWDGTSCMVRDGKLYKRYDAKRGRTPPAGFEPAEPAPDPKTGHWPGWVPVTRDDKAHLEALDNSAPNPLLSLTGWPESLPDGTYELCGPSISTARDRALFDAEGFGRHVLIRHGALPLPDPVMHPHPVPRDFEGLKAWFAREYERGRYIEGIVWHHPDGRMAKVKARDFGIERPDSAPAAEKVVPESSAR